MFLKEFFRAIKSYATAGKLIREYNLYSFFYIPAIISLLIGIFIIFIAYYYSTPISEFIISLWTFDFGQDAVRQVGKWGSAILILGVGIVIYKHLVLALSSPFMGALSERIEEITTGKLPHPKPFLQVLIRGLRINLRNLVYELMYTLPLLLLSLIPVLNIATTILLFYIQSYYAGFGNMDYTMERYLDYKESIQFAQKHKGIAVGNGLLFTALLFIPILGMLITLPLSTSASTLDVLNTINKNHNKDDLGVPITA